ncbi:MAG TPA: c-type cytochrome [Myxococcota bacterium]|nr:c-type cytochrome [Myxococcota bacterium]
MSGEMLRDGAKLYAFRCATCHGALGDGNGPTGRAQNPKPRDFRLGVLKFASTKAGELAPDADYARIITKGLKGTNMLALPMPPNEVEAVTYYVKSLSATWLDPSAKAGTPVAITADPWSDGAAAVAKGNELIKTRCASCHATDGNEGTGSDSVFGTLRAPKLAQGLTLKAGATASDIYRTLAAGVGGTAMTPLKGAISEEDLWALVHVVDTFAD